MTVFHHLCMLQVGFLAWITTSSSEEIFSVNRRYFDWFVVPDSLCILISTACEKFQAVSSVHRRCACKCRNTGKGTFGYLFGAWQCVSGSSLRTQEQCKVLFIDEKMKGELSVFTAPTVVHLSSNTFSAAGRNCSVDEKWSYLGCNGEWKIASKARSTFTLMAGSQVDIKAAKDHAGKIVKLGISCEERVSSGKSPPSATKHCVLFKLAGTMRCNSSLSTPTSLPKTKGKTQTTKQAIETQPVTSEFQTTTEFSPSDGKSQGSKNEKQESSISVIVPSVVIPLTVLTLVILVAVILRKRKHRRKKQPRKSLSRRKCSIPDGVSGKFESAGVTPGNEEIYGGSNQTYQTLSPKQRENNFYHSLVKGNYTPSSDNTIIESHYEELKSYSKDTQPRSGKFIDNVYDEPIVNSGVRPKSAEENEHQNEAYEEPINNEPPVYLQVI